MEGVAYVIFGIRSRLAFSLTGLWTLPGLTYSNHLDVMGHCASFLSHFSFTTSPQMNFRVFKGTFNYGLVSSPVFNSDKWAMSACLEVFSRGSHHTHKHTNLLHNASKAMRLTSSTTVWFGQVDHGRIERAVCRNIRQKS